MNRSISINLTSLAVGTAESFWLNVKDVKTLSDTVTLEEAADFIDKLYDLNPCNPDDSDGGDEPAQDEEGNIEPPVEEDEFLALVQSFMAGSGMCGAFDGSYECQIRVARSHRDFPYKLALDNGEEVVRIKTQETVTQVVPVEDQASVTLELPVIANAVYQWDGLVIDKSGACPDPDVTVLGSTVNFGKDVTGVLRATYLTEYDLVTVKVYGKDGSNDPQPCHATIFYHGLVVEHDIEVPEKDEQAENDRQRLCDPDNVLDPTPDGVSCYEIVNNETRCRCSGSVVDSEPSKVGVTCPDGITCPGAETECQHFMGSRSVTTGYVSCPAEEDLEGTVGDPDYYEDKCCTPPPRGLPPCKTITNVFKGGKGVSAEDKAAYPGAVFVGVGPADGVCGETETTFQVNALNCCDGVETMAWDEPYCATVVPGMFKVTGGKPPYIWRVTGQGFSFHYSLLLNEIEDSNGTVWVYDLEDACGAGTLSVTDSCGQSLRRNIQAPQGYWKSDGNPADEYTDDDLNAMKLGCGWERDWDCCTGPLMFCGIEGLTGYSQCETWSQAEYTYGSEVQPQLVNTDNKYRIRRTSCSIGRCTTCYNVCGDVSNPCTAVDPVSGLEFTLLTTRICWNGGECGEGDTLNMAVGITNIREIWSCEE